VRYITSLHEINRGVDLALDNRARQKVFHGEVYYEAFLNTLANKIEVKYHIDCLRIGIGDTVILPRFDAHSLKLLISIVCLVDFF